MRRGLPGGPSLLSLLALGLILAGYAWRLPRGLDLGDEAYYANFYAAWLRGPLAETGDLAAHQPSQSLVFPAAWLYSRFEPGLDGLVLFLRWLYALAALLTALLVLRASPGSGRVRAALALLVVGFIPFAMPAPSYNTLGMLASLGCGVSLARSFTLPASRERRRWLAAGVLLGGLQTFAYPTLAPLPFLAALLLCWRTPGTTSPRLRRGAIALGLLVVAHLLVLAVVLATFGVDRLRQMAEFSAAYGVNFSVPKKLALAAMQLTQQPEWLALTLGLLLLNGLRLLLPLRLPLAMATGYAVTRLLLQEPAALAFRTHAIVLMLAIGGLPTLRHLLRPAATPEQAARGVLYLVGLVGGLLTSWTSNNALLNFPVGGLLAVWAVLADLGEPPHDSRGSRVCAALLLASVLLALGVGSATRFYGESPGVRVSARVMQGPYAGLLTTPERAALLEGQRERLQQLGSEDESVSVFGISPGWYLQTRMRSRTPHSWPLTAELDGLRPILERHYADPRNLPEAVVWHLPPSAIHPVQREALARHYQLLDVRDELLTFRRRDLNPPASSLPLVIWGDGFWPLETDGVKRWRWALGDASVSVTHFGDRPRQLRIRGEYKSYHPEPAELTVSLGGQEFTLPIGPEAKSFEFRFTLPPGESVLRWHCTARPLRDPARTIVFALLDAEVQLLD